MRQIGAFFAVSLILASSGCGTAEEELVAPEQTGAVSPAKPEIEGCGYDEEAMLALDADAFDQSPDGWRALADRGGCDREVAGLIAKYRATHGLDTRGLVWHQAQALAFADDYAAAADLITGFAEGDYACGTSGRCIYAQGTLAFLQRDFEALVVARDRLAAISGSGSAYLNAKVLDRLVRCFDRPYSEAYANCPIEQAD